MACSSEVLIARVDTVEAGKKNPWPMLTHGITKIVAIIGTFSFRQPHAIIPPSILKAPALTNRFNFPVLLTAKPTSTLVAAIPTSGDSNNNPDLVELVCFTACKYNGILKLTVDESIDPSVLPQFRLPNGMLDSKFSGSSGRKALFSTKISPIPANKQVTSAVMTNGCVQLKMLPPRLMPRMSPAMVKVSKAAPAKSNEDSDFLIVLFSAFARDGPR